MREFRHALQRFCFICTKIFLSSRFTAANDSLKHCYRLSKIAEIEHRVRYSTYATALALLEKYLIPVFTFYLIRDTSLPSKNKSRITSLLKMTSKELILAIAFLNWCFLQHVCDMLCCNLCGLNSNNWTVMGRNYCACEDSHKQFIIRHSPSLNW